MSAKHTPGPWGIFGYDIGTAPDETLAVVCAMDDSVDDANAHLIAAAPDLLEALEALVISHRALCDSPSWDEQDEAEQAQARAIIAKAKGVI